MNVAPFNGQPKGVEWATPAELAAIATFLGSGRKLKAALLFVDDEPGGGSCGAAAGGGARVPIYRIRQESVRRHKGKYDHTEVSRWRVWFGFVDVLLPESVAAEHLIRLMRSDGKEFAADALTEAVRKSMPGGGEAGAQAAREILSGRDGAETPRGRVGDVNERDVMWDKAQIAGCLLGMAKLRREIRRHEDVGDLDSNGCQRLKEKLEEQQDLLAANARKGKGGWVPKAYQKGTFSEKANVIGKHFRKLLGGYLRQNCRPLFDHLNDQEVLRYGARNWYRPKPRINWEVELMEGKKGT